MRKQIVKVVSGIMLVVFFLGIAPKEYIHDVLFHHHDTVHPVYKKGEFSFTSKHTHCSFVGFVFAPFVGSEQQFLSFEADIVHNSGYLSPVYHFSYSSIHTTLSLRGPPAIS